MNSQSITRTTPRPQPTYQDCRCTHCGNINRQTLPGHPCTWSSGNPAELQADPGANCGGELVAL